MSLDPKIKDAILRAVEETGQDVSLANKLIAWVDDLSSGNERVDDTESVHRHLNLLFDAIKVEVGEQ